MEKNCATCGWGVQWTRSVLDGRLHGRCLFVPSIPLPKGMIFPRFGEKTPMPTRCPGWGKPKDVELVPRWLEEDIDYILRASRHMDEKVASLEAQMIAEDPELAARIGLVNKEAR